MLGDGRFYLGHLGKTPVYVSPDAALNLLLVWMWCDKSLQGFLVTLMAFLTVILVHESGHAVIARVMGMQGISITISAFGGFCTYGGARRPKTELPIAVSGPVFNLLTALLLWLISAYAFPFARLDPPIGSYLSSTLIFSLILGIFNLLPIYPLDGGQATLAVSRMMARNDGNARRFTLSVTVATAGAVVLALLYLQAAAFFTFFILAMLLVAAFRDLR